MGVINVTYEKFVFHTRKQQDGKSVDAYVASLRSLVKTCKFCEICIEGILRDQIVLGIKNPETQDTLLKERELTLVRCM